jgi:hypothetical protein
MEYFIKLYKKKKGKDIRKDNRAVQKLRREVEKAKRSLSSGHQTRIGVWFLSKKNILIPNVTEKNILILVEEKKSLIHSFCHNLMLHSGKNFALCPTKKINILTLVLSEKKILNETKNHNHPPIIWYYR